MGLSYLRSFLPLEAVLFLGLVITAFHPALVSAQSFCGPVTVANFNGINGQYPAAGVTVSLARLTAGVHFHGRLRQGV